MRRPTRGILTLPTTEPNESEKNDLVLSRLEDLHAQLLHRGELGIDRSGLDLSRTPYGVAT